VLLFKRAKALDPMPAIARRRPWIKEVQEFYLLIRGNCIYGSDLGAVAQKEQLRPQYRDDLLVAENCYRRPDP